MHNPVDARRGARPGKGADAAAARALAAVAATPEQARSGAPPVSEWVPALRLLLDHRLYELAVRVARLALAALPEQAAGAGTLHHLLAVALTETGQPLLAAAHYARALDEVGLAASGEA
jgi:hypothetical protein